MDSLRKLRNLVFEDMGKSRIKRIFMCAFVIASIWTFADIVRGNLSFNLWHDLICLGMGVVAERLIPWGKTAESPDTQKLIQTNKQLLELIDEQNKVLKAVAGKKSA